MRIESRTQLVCHECGHVLGVVYPNDSFQKSPEWRLYLHGRTDCKNSEQVVKIPTNVLELPSV